jgi:hypothetical protein
MNGYWVSMLTVFKLGENWQICDWKSERTKIVKKLGNWHFRFNERKRFVFNKAGNNVTVRGEVFYGFDLGSSRSILRKGKNLSLFRPVIVNIGNALKGDKSSIDTYIAEETLRNKLEGNS